MNKYEYYAEIVYTPGGKVLAVCLNEDYADSIADELNSLLDEQAQVIRLLEELAGRSARIDKDFVSQVADLISDL